MKTKVGLINLRRKLEALLKSELKKKGKCLYEYD